MGKRVSSLWFTLVLAAHFLVFGDTRYHSVKVAARNVKVARRAERSAYRAWCKVRGTTAGTVNGAAWLAYVSRRQDTRICVQLHRAAQMAEFDNRARLNVTTLPVRIWARQYAYA